MEFDHRLLRGRIIALFGSQKAYAEKAGISEQSLGMKLNNKNHFSVCDIITACDLLNIPDEDIKLYFFTKIV